MTQFIMGFTVYTLGIIGVLSLGFLGAKYFMNNTGIRGFTKKKEFLKIDHALSLEPRKAVYVLQAGNQRFLVATTPDNVSFLSELDPNNVQVKESTETVSNTMPKMHPDLEAKLKYVNLTRNLVGKETIKR